MFSHLAFYGDRFYVSDPGAAPSIFLFNVLAFCLRRRHGVLVFSLMRLSFCQHRMGDVLAFCFLFKRRRHGLVFFAALVHSPLLAPHARRPRFWLFNAPVSILAPQARRGRFAAFWCARLY